MSGGEVARVAASVGSRSFELPDDLARDLHLPHRVVEVGPEHPLLHGSVQLRVELDGDVIAGLEVAPGFLHRGFEKECEGRPWSEVVPFVDRLNYQSSALCSAAYCGAVEKLLGWELPIRAQWLRVVACEIARIADHLTRCAATCAGLGATAPEAYALDAREFAWDLSEMLCGARVTTHYIRVGGVASDLPAEFGTAVEEKLGRLERRLKDVEGVIAGSRTWSGRLKDVAVLSAGDCVRYSVTGPLLRASGVPYDLRRSAPYLTYEEIAFDVPVGEVGDNYDRFSVCVEEIRQSAGIVRQCVARLTELPRDAIRLSQALPTETRGGAADFEVESANGELGFHLRSDGFESADRVRCRAPSFFHLQALPQMLRGSRFDDLMSTVGLLNCVGGECDR